MASTVRVFLLTYRRPHMIRRALECLVGQDFKDWMCEVHNDWPGDAAVIDDIVASLGDERFEVIHHPENWGGTRSFNLAFESRHKEPFFSILEDDNYWHRNFLSRMLTSIGKHPGVAAAWCNQQIRAENRDGGFSAIAELVGPSGASDRLVEYGDVNQALGSLHADGAMVIRTSMTKGLVLPADLPFSAIELFRDRAFPYPLLYVPEPLAVFTMTLQTGRSASMYEWFLMQSLAAGSFLKFCDGGLVARTFEYWRSSKPRSTNPLLMGLLMNGCLGLALQNAKVADWLLLFKAVLRRPHFVWVLTERPRHRRWSDFLDRNTRQRFLEKRLVAANGETSRPSCVG
ncbi:MAG: glycosyltransferase [Reyranella sp.]|nr:glycosyltransferase [Reyranella sp.]